MKQLKDRKTLRDLGERKIITDYIVPRFPAGGQQIVGIGDDCAVLRAAPKGHLIVVTMDPCPTPVICLVETPDLYHYGRLTALINVSDLAAMGATPVGLQVSTVMPEDMLISDFERFLDGLADASREWSCPVVGGNIKDGSDFSATGAAFGFVKKDQFMRRQGAAPGDQVYVVGEMGLFWAAVLSRIIAGIKLEDSAQSKLDKALYKPAPMIREGMALAKSQGVSTCMDSSDGVTGCLFEIAKVNSVDIMLDGNSLQPHPAVSQVAAGAKIDHRKLMLAWGDWELVCTIPKGKVKKVTDILASLGSKFYKLGEVRQGSGKVWLHDAGHEGLLVNLASERFSGTSYFTHGLDAYIHFLRNQPLVKKDPQSREN